MAAEINSVARIPEFVSRAFHVATSGGLVPSFCRFPKICWSKSER